MKYFNIKRYKFSTIIKKFNIFLYSFDKVSKLIDIRRYNLKRFYYYFNIQRIDFNKVKKYFFSTIYNLKKITLSNNKVIFFHLPAAIAFFSFLYIAIPTLYKYDKNVIEKKICSVYKITCSIKGDIKYRFYPTPRIKIKDIEIKDFTNKNKIFLKIDQTDVKLSFKNLLVKEKHKFKKINLKNYEANFNIKNFNKYKSIINKKDNILPINFVRGRILFFDRKEYIATINNAKIDLNFFEDVFNFELKGDFLNDNLLIKLNNKKVEDKIVSEITLKMPGMNIISKIKLINSEKNKKVTSGNFLIKKNKNKILGFFDYKNNEIILTKSNLRNSFMEGDLEGKIKFLPYFNFDLDVNLNSLNFTRLYNHFLSLSEISKKNIFKFNNKVNGKLSLSSNKVYSKSNLVKSFESRLKFNNSNLFINQFLINLGKLGAADMLGSVNNDKKYSAFKFESNVYVDNQKKFLSKFGIYSKKKISPNLFISGNFDLDNSRLILYEILAGEKINKEDVDFMEKEFNNLMLEEGYKTLFDFRNFKEFIKAITNIEN